MIGETKRFSAWLAPIATIASNFKDDEDPLAPGRLPSSIYLRSNPTRPTTHRKRTSDVLGGSCSSHTLSFLLGSREGDLVFWPHRLEGKDSVLSRQGTRFNPECGYHFPLVESNIIDTMPENKPFSLSARLGKAEDNSDILQLLAEGSKYEFASAKTKRRWKRVAAARRAALERPNQPTSPTPVKAPAGKTKYASKKKVKA